MAVEFLNGVDSTTDGATADGRLRGNIASGPPSSGVWAVGDVVTANNGHIWICTTAGTAGAGAAFTAVRQLATSGTPVALGTTASLGSDVRAAPLHHVHPTTGLVLTVNSTAPDANGNVVLSSTTPDATASVKGVVQLAGDLGGTAAAPTVTGLAGKLTASSNLSDLASAVTARSNLGLGGAAILNVGSTGATVAAGDAPATAVSTHAGLTATHGVSGAIVGTTDTQTLTNKRITRRAATVAVSANTYTPNADTTDLARIVTPTANFTVANPSGTPVEGQLIQIMIRNGGTAYTPSWGAGYGTDGVNALPTSQPSGKVTLHGFQWDNTLSKWILIASNNVGWN